MKVMLDKDLVDIYGVSTSNLNKAVKRNLNRFPNDFMFQMKEEEFNILMFQIGISRWGRTRKIPYCFTEQGIAMLSGVLNSNRAIEANIRIIRNFIRMREMMINQKNIIEKLDELEQNISKNSENIELIFKTIRQMLLTPVKPLRKVGYRRKDEQ